MLGHKDIDLIQRSIDGVASTRDLARLGALLAENAEARAEHERLASLVALLAEDRDVEPSANLRIIIENRVASAAARQDINRKSSLFDRVFTRSHTMNYSGPSRQSNKKYWYVGGATVVVVVLIFVITRSMQLAPNDETSGTIGGVKKYNAVQMSDQDIKLRTLLMSDTASLRDYLRTLKMLKDFAVAVNHDLELWKKDMTAMDTKVRVRKLKGGFTMQGKSEEFGEYANFITANIGVLDNMIAMLTKMAAADTAGKAFEIDRTFNDFENFRVKFGEKFQQVMNAVPEIHNTMVKNGLASGLLGSLDCRLQYVVGSGTIESHPIGSATLLGSGETVGCCLYSNGGAGGAGGLGANGPLLGSGEGGMGSVVGSNMIGSMILSRDQVFSFFGSHPLGVIVDGNVPLGSLGLGNGQLGAAFTNRP